MINTKTDILGVFVRDKKQVYDELTAHEKSNLGNAFGSFFDAFFICTKKAVDRC